MSIVHTKAIRSLAALVARTSGTIEVEAVFVLGDSNNTTVHTPRVTSGVTAGPTSKNTIVRIITFEFDHDPVIRKIVSH
jgi:hypothetical protein